MSLALYLDHNVRSAVTRGLRQRGADVITALEDGSSELDDESLLRRANDLRRVFFTHDDDFLAIAARWISARRPFSDVLYSHQYRLTVRQLLAELELIAKAGELEDMRNRVDFLPL